MEDYFQQLVRSWRSVTSRTVREAVAVLLLLIVVLGAGFSALTTYADVVVFDEDRFAQELVLHHRCPQLGLHAQDACARSGHDEPGRQRAGVDARRGTAVVRRGADQATPRLRPALEPRSGRVHDRLVADLPKALWGASAVRCYPRPLSPVVRC